MIDKLRPTGDENKSVFSEAMTELNNGCVSSVLLSALNGNSGLQVEINDGQYAATYSPCGRQIQIGTANANDIFYWRGEIFHAFQDQYYGNDIIAKMSLNQIQSGGSNIEAEEKALNILAGLFESTIISGSGQDKLTEWVMKFIDNHPFGSKIEGFSETEINEWFSAVDAYQQYWKDIPNSALNGRPVDYNMLPNAFLELFKDINCEYP